MFILHLLLNNFDCDCMFYQCILHPPLNNLNYDPLVLQIYKFSKFFFKYLLSLDKVKVQICSNFYSSLLKNFLTSLRTVFKFFFDTQIIFFKNLIVSDVFCFNFIYGEDQKWLHMGSPKWTLPEQLFAVSSENTDFPTKLLNMKIFCMKFVTKKVILIFGVRWLLLLKNAHVSPKCFKPVYNNSCPTLYYCTLQNYYFLQKFQFFPNLFQNSINLIHNFYPKLSDNFFYLFSNFEKIFLKIYSKF